MISFSTLRVERLVVGPIMENTYILWDEPSKEGYVIDPGGEIEKILRVIEKHGLKILKILTTHAHHDHVIGVMPLKKELKVPVAMHLDSKPACQILKMFARLYQMTEEEVEIPVIDEPLKEGEMLPLGTHKIKVLDTAGHCPGHITLYVPPWLFVGDVIFKGSIGRTDLPGGETELLMKNINEKLLPLPDDTVLFPGHGPETTIGLEKKTNPFLTGTARLK